MINHFATLLSNFFVGQTLNHQPLQKDLCTLLDIRRIQDKFKTWHSLRAMCTMGMGGQGAEWRPQPTKDTCILIPGTSDYDRLHGKGE